MFRWCQEIPLIPISEEACLEIESKFLHWPKDQCNECNIVGETPLLASLRLRCADHVVFHLIDLGSDVNIQNKLRIAPIHIAATRTSSAVIRKLLQSGADINAKDGAGNTALHKAVIFARMTNIEELLKHPDIDYDAKNNNNETALYLSAIYTGVHKLTNMLSDLDGERMTIALLDRGCDINLTNRRNNQTVLHRAIIEDEEKAIETFVRRGADVNIRDVNLATPLHTAIHYSCNEIVYMLLYFGANGDDTNIEGKTPLEMAILAKKEEIAEYLLLYATNVNHRNFQDIPLLHTALDHSPNIALKLIEAGADVNTAFNGKDCIYISLYGNNGTLDLFQVIWSRLDINLLFENRSNDGNPDYLSILELILHNDSFCNDHFLKSLFMVFESPYIDLIIQNHIDLSDFDCLHLYHTFERCKFDLSLDEKLKITYLFLYHNIEIYYEDVQYIYCECGFDEYVELLLKHGDQLQHLENMEDTNLLFCRIWYNHFRKFPNIKYFFNEDMIEKYRRFFRANFVCDLHAVETEYPYIVTEVPSLVQLSRDAVRNVVYKKWNTKQHYKVYQALSQLPVPSSVRDILYLKRPIYEVEDRS